MMNFQFREAFHRLFDSCNNHRRRYCGKGNQKLCEKQYQSEEAFYQHGQTMFRTTMRTFLGQSISQFQTQFTNQTEQNEENSAANSIYDQKIKAKSLNKTQFVALGFVIPRITLENCEETAKIEFHNVGKMNRSTSKVSK